MTSDATRVLVVEDDTWQGELLASHCQKAGFDARLADNAIMALEMVDEFRPHVLVLDMFLGGSNGLVLIHELRSHADLADVPIIVCSGSSLDLPEEDLKLYGIVAWLDKAVMQPQDVVTQIRKVLT